jgi:hypothetical protein
MRAVTLMLSFLTVTSTAGAQRWALREVHQWGTAGVSAALMIPVGEFAEHVSTGGGMTGFMAFNLDPAGFSALRIDGSFLAYGRAVDVSYGTYYYSRGVVTTSFIAGLRAGPQITLGSGPMRLYGFGQAGFSYFATTTDFRDCYCGGSDAVTEHDDITWGWESGGGMLLRLGHGGRILIDLGARFQQNGRAQYLPAWLVADGAPIESEANLVALHLGVTVGLR